MDAVVFRIANKLVGNADREAGLEISAMSLTLKFMCDTTVALTGAKLGGTINGKQVCWWETLQVEKGGLTTQPVIVGCPDRTHGQFCILPTGRI